MSNNTIEWSVYKQALTVTTTLFGKMSKHILEKTTSSTKGAGATDSEWSYILTSHPVHKSVRKRLKILLGD